jgi:hypothetical protein
VNLEQELRALPIAFPAEPDLRANVLARLERRQRRWRSQLVAVLAVLAAFGALLAIPQTRAAILRVLEIGGVRIERTETEPRGVLAAPVTGRRVTLEEARRAVTFELAVPRERATVYLNRGIPGGMVSFVWGEYVLSQWQGEQLPYVQKSAGPRTQLRELSVEGARGVWITGAPHSVVFVDRNGQPREQTRRLAGNVLVWERDGVTYRLEGADSRDEARDVVASDL